MKLHQIIEEYTIEESIAAIAIASLYDGTLYEAEDLNEASLNKLLNKIGLTLHRSGKGLVDYVKGFAQGSGRILLAALQGDKAKVKEIAQQVKKEDVIDFLLKLDMATMHLVSGPIHVVDAITGWDLWANVKHAASSAKSVYDEIKDALITAKNKIASYISGPKKQQMLDPIETLLVMLGVDV